MSWEEWMEEEGMEEEWTAFLPEKRSDAALSDTALSDEALSDAALCEVPSDEVLPEALS